MPAVVRREAEPMLRGTLTSFRRRCGKANCRCATGEPHVSPALTYSEGGRTKTLTLSDADLPEAAAALARYEAARKELEQRADAGIAGLRARRSGRRQ